MVSARQQAMEEDWGRLEWREFLDLYAGKKTHLAYSGILQEVLRARNKMTSV
jgi:hypothetical protein